LLFFFLYLLLLASSPSYSATKKALLIGIDNYKNLPFFSKELKRTITNLKGSINDTHIMSEMLISYFGFRREDILVLKDSEATRDSIISNFKDWLINGTKKGDLTVFYFSGHGAQVPESVSGDEPDKLDEALCPYDVVPVGAGNVDEAKLIIDDEIGTLLKKLIGRDVVFIADCCHSGTLTRAIRGVPVSKTELTPGYQARFMPVKMKGFQIAWNTFPENIFKRNYKSEEIPEGHIYLYSCRENQISIEMPLPSRFYGVFTKLFVEGIEQRKGEITYGDLYTYTRKRIKDHHSLGLRQDPKMESREGRILDRKVFSLGSKDELELTQSLMEKPKPPIQKAVKLLGPSQTMAIPGRTLPGLSLQTLGEIRKDKVLVRVEAIQGGNTYITKSIQNGLSRLPYVETVEGEIFDRLIRGENKSGQCHVRVLNRIGDVIQIPPKKSIDELIKIIAPHLEYAFIAKQLDLIRQPNPPFKVSISVADERRDFRIGEKVVYSISCEEDCYLLMLNLDSLGNFQIIFPNKYHKDNFIKAGRNIQIPDKEMVRNRFEFQFYPPAGEETVKVIATNTKVAFESLSLSNFREGFETVSGSAMGESSPSRRLAKEILTIIEERSKDKEFRWSENTVVVRSH